MIYLDGSVALAYLLAEDRYPRVGFKIRTAMPSAA